MKNLDKRFREFYDNAVELAAICHKGQYRKGCNVPYIKHCLDVAAIVESFLVDPKDDDVAQIMANVLAAAVLHDVIEDTDINEVSIRTMFNGDVLRMIRECTRKYDHNSKELKLNFLKSFRFKSSFSVIIKIADRYCNTMDYYRAGSKEYASWYALQAYPLYAEFYKMSFELIKLDVVEDIVGKLFGIIAENFNRYLLNADKLDLILTCEDYNSPY